MLEKITFEKKLGIDSSEKRYLGIKISTISFIVAFFGFVLFSLGIELIGRTLIYLGIFSCFIGLAITFFYIFDDYARRKEKESEPS